MLFPTPNQQCQSTEGLTNIVTPTRLEIHYRRRTITRPTVHTDMTVHCHLMDSAYCMVTQCHSLRLAELRRYDGKCTFSLSLSSSSSCWNIGRRAFSISVCRCSLADLFAPIHVNPISCKPSLNVVVRQVFVGLPSLRLPLSGCQFMAIYAGLFPADVRYGPQISASFVAQSQISFPNDQ